MLSWFLLTGCHNPLRTEFLHVRGEREGLMEDLRGASCFLLDSLDGGLDIDFRFDEEEHPDVGFVALRVPIQALPPNEGERRRIGGPLFQYFPPGADPARSAFTFQGAISLQLGPLGVGVEATAANTRAVYLHELRWEATEVTDGVQTLPLPAAHLTDVVMLCTDGRTL